MAVLLWLFATSAERGSELHCIESFAMKLSSYQKKEKEGDGNFVSEDLSATSLRRTLPYRSAQPEQARRTTAFKVSSF